MSGNDYREKKNLYKSKGQLDSIADSLSLATKSLREKRIAVQNARDAEIERARSEAAREAVLSSIVYASGIQKNLLPSASVFENAFFDYSIIWEPRDIVSGDIYWIKSFGKGTVLCVCDCTGHGIPGAFLTMLVVSILESVVSESVCTDTAGIMKALDERLSGALNSSDNQAENDLLDIKDGCDIAVLFISKKGDLHVSSSNIRVFICNGKEITKLKGQRLSVGEGKIGAKNSIKITTIPFSPDNKYYISSDGLFDQIGSEEKNPLGIRPLSGLFLGTIMNSKQ